MNAPVSVTFPYMIAKEFPDALASPLIDRSNFIETIARVFGGTSVVFLEGEEGSGTTTTAAQFCIENPVNTFALFIKPASRIAYSADYLRLVLAEQIYWFLEGKTYQNDVVDVSDFQRLLLRLRRRATACNPVYFIVDGMHQIGVDEHRAIELIMKEILPIGWDHVKFLIVGDQDRFDRYLNKTTSKYCQQLTFTLSESRIFLAPLGLGEEDERSIHNLCNGIPGRLAILKRLLSGSVSLEEILKSHPSKYLEFIRLEFDSVGELPAPTKKLLAVFTFSNRLVDVSEICQIAQVGSSVLSELLHLCPFVRLTSNSLLIEFVSDAHRRFCSNLLADLRDEAIKAQIDYLVQHPGSAVAVRFLPVYYQQLGQTQELIRLLSSEHFCQLLEETESVRTLQNRAELGLKTASVLAQVSEVFNFSIKRSVFSSIAGADGIKSEIRALVALGEVRAALYLAQESVVREERLAFLCAFAQRCKDTLNFVDPEVLSYIRETAKGIKFEELGDKSIDIACELVSVDPELAMSIFDDAQKGVNDSKETDIAFVRMTLAAGKSSPADREKSFGLVSRRISDENLQRFTSSLNALMTNFSADRIISITETIDEIHRLPFLCRWLRKQKKMDKTLKVASYALDLMIGTSTYSPKMRDLGDIASALPFFASRDDAVALINRIDGQVGIIRDASVSADSTSMQMSLAEAEYRIDPARSANRVIESYYEILELDSPESQLECFAIMLEALYRINDLELFEKKHQLKTLISDELRAILDKVLRDSADQFLIVKGALKALAKVDLAAACTIAGRLNNLSRREEAFSHIVRTIFVGECDDNLLDEAFKTITRIKIADNREAVIDSCIHSLVTSKRSIRETLFDQLTTAVCAFENAERTCSAVIALAEIWASNPTYNCERLIDLFSKQIDLVDSAWSRADFCFCFASSLASENKEVAKGYYDKGASIKSDAVIGSRDLTQVVVYCLVLLNRAFSGAMRAKCFDDDFMTRYLRLVEYIPSSLAKSEVLGDLACRAWIAKRLDVADSLMRQSFIPLIDSALSKNSRQGAHLIATLFPAMYCTRPDVAVSYVTKMPRVFLEQVIMNTIDLILTRSTLSDPAFDEKADKLAITHADAMSVFTLIKHLETDSKIYSAADGLISTLSAKVNRNSLTINQRRDLAAKLREVFSAKLPDPENIQHEGYLILCEALALVLSEEVSYKSWELLVNRGRKISNLADSGFVLQRLASILPKKFSSLFEELNKEAIALYSRLPSPIDQVNHLIDMSSATSVIYAKQGLRAAMTMTLASRDVDLAKRSQRRIVDLADKISPQFADEVSDMIDQDPTREIAKQEVMERRATLSVKRKLANNRNSEEITEAEVEHLPEASWMNTASLMSGRIETRDPELFIEYLKKSSSLPLENAYPVLVWHVENLTKKYSNARSGDAEILSLVENLLLTSELTLNLVDRLSRRRKQYALANAAEDKLSFPLGVNNRDECVEFLASWLSNCSDDIILCDPYFGPDQLGFLRLIVANCPSCSLTILTSKAFLVENSALSDESFLRKWNEMMDQDPPATTIIATSYLSTAKSPIHDRWLICGNRGVALGTSFGSLGTGKLTGIVPMTSEHVTSVASILDRFIDGERTIDGTKVGYSSFTL